MMISSPTIFVTAPSLDRHTLALGVNRLTQEMGESNPTEAELNFLAIVDMGTLVKTSGSSGTFSISSFSFTAVLFPSYDVQNMSARKMAHWCHRRML